MDELKVAVVKLLVTNHDFLMGEAEDAVDESFRLNPELWNDNAEAKDLAEYLASDEDNDQSVYIGRDHSQGWSPSFVQGIMKPPRPFKINSKRGYSICIACDNWKISNNIFHHEGRHWILCRFCFADYWENTDILQSDYVGYNV